MFLCFYFSYIIFLLCALATLINITYLLTYMCSDVNYYYWTVYEL